MENVEIVEENIDEEVKTEKTFTQEELDKIIEKRLAKEKAKAHIEKQEAEKLAKMSEAERQEALFEKKMTELENREKEFNKREMQLQVEKELASKDLPCIFSDYLVGETAEESMEKISEFEKNINEYIEKKIEKRLYSTGYVPPNSDKLVEQLDPFLQAFKK